MVARGARQHQQLALPAHAAVRDQIFTDEAQLRANVFDYIEVFYNRFRKHASLGYLSPAQAEEKNLPPMGGMEQPGCRLSRN